MPITLYGAMVASLRQGLSALDLILGRAQTHFHQQCTPLNEIVGARLAPEMLPFSFQIVQDARRSMGAINGSRQGLTSTSTPPPPTTCCACTACHWASATTWAVCG